MPAEFTVKFPAPKQTEQGVLVGKQSTENSRDELRMSSQLRLVQTNKTANIC